MAGRTLQATEALAKLTVEEIARDGKTFSSKLSSVLQGSKVLRPVDKLQTGTINLGIRKCLGMSFKFHKFKPHRHGLCRSTVGFHLDKILDVNLVRSVDIPIHEGLSHR